MAKDMEKQTGRSAFRIILIIVATAGLLLTLVPSFLNWQGFTGPEQVNRIMIVGAILWFIPAVFLFGKKREKAD